IRRDEFPRDKNGRFAFRNEQLLFDDETVVDLITPAGPRVAFETVDARSAVRMNYIGAIALRGNRKSTARRFHPCVKAVRQDHSSRWRRRCRQQQRVITTAANPRDRSAGESAETIRLEPFG